MFCPNLDRSAGALRPRGQGRCLNGSPFRRELFADSAHSEVQLVLFPTGVRGLRALCNAARSAAWPGRRSPARLQLSRHEARSLLCGRDRRGRVKKLGYRDNDLGSGKGLRKQEAVRDALGRPLLPVSAGHVDDGDRRIDLPGRATDLPSIDRSQQADVGHDRPVFGFVVPSEGFRA